MFLDVVRKIRDSFLSVLPVFVVVVVLYILEKFNIGLTHIGDMRFILFIIAAVLMAVGMYLFELGADSAIAKMGELVGSTLTKKQSIGLLVLILFLFGAFVTVAEPDLSVFASQVFPGADKLLVKWLLIISIVITN